VKAALEYDGSCYLRLGRAKVDDITGSVAGYRFELGKGVQLADGKDVTIVATGMMVQQAVKASELLKNAGISARVIDIHTIKPLDADILIKAAKETGAIVTTEEHNVLCGLGGAVSEVISQNYPVPVIRHGVMDQFGKSGTAEALMIRYGLTAEKIAECAKEAIALKR
jgi:transketolase